MKEDRMQRGESWSIEESLEHCKNLYNLQLVHTSTKFLPSDLYFHCTEEKFDLASINQSKAWATYAHKNLSVGETMLLRPALYVEHKSDE